MLRDLEVSGESPREGTLSAFNSSDLKKDFFFFFSATAQAREICLGIRKRGVRQSYPSECDLREKTIHTEKNKIIEVLSMKTRDRHSIC